MPNDDYIKRSDALKAVCETCSEHGETGEPCDGHCGDYALIQNIPAADVELVRHGRWEVGDYAEPDGHGVCVNHYPKGGLYCTKCRHGWKRERVEGFEFCPNCRAKMDGGEDDAV